MFWSTTQGLLLHGIVGPPLTSRDRDGGLTLPASLFGLPLLEKTVRRQCLSDRPIFHRAMADILPHLETEIVKRSDRVTGFVVLPKRWIVGSSIAWLNRCRRTINGQRLGKPQPQRTRAVALVRSSLQSASAQKTL